MSPKRPNQYFVSLLDFNEWLKKIVKSLRELQDWASTTLAPILVALRKS